MNIGAVLVGVALLVFSAAVVMTPFRKKPVDRRRTNSPKSDPKDERQKLLLSIRALDFDHELGQVGEDDYTRLRAQLFTEAGQLTERIEQKADDQLEAMIRARREITLTKALSCPECGHPSHEGDRFCVKCGAPSPKTCPSCGQQAASNHHFCAQCGHQFPETVL